MPGGLEELLAAAHLDDLAQVHHRDPIGDVAHHTEVVGDEEIGQSHAVAQIRQQIEHLGLDADVERGDRFVADDEPRPERECPRDADTLSLSTR
ncbi:hypothetical protein AWW71_29380 [Bacillus cereus]|nr:hypothetical protein AWW71_29380 [Bacillus cereus]